MESYYVIGENSDRKIVSPSQESIEEAKRYILRAEEIDKRYGESFIYFITKFIPLSQMVKDIATLNP